MKIEQIRRAIEVSNTGSINRAAQNLYVAQSSLSASIQTLETELGHAIFKRTQTGITLTPFGECFIEHARAILQHVNEIETASATRAEDRAPLRLDVMVYYLMFATHALARLYNQYKNERTEFNYMERTRSEMIAGVASGKAEIGLVMMPSIDTEKWLALLSAQGLEYNRITIEQPVALVGPNSELYHAGYETITPHVLANRKMIIIPEENELFQIIDRKIFRQFSPSGYLNVCDRGSLVSMLNQTNGYYIGTRNKGAYNRVPYYADIDTFQVIGSGIQFEIGYIKRHAQPLSPIAQEYLGIIESMIA